jgi:hypothetical protein
MSEKEFFTDKVRVGGCKKWDCLRIMSVRPENRRDFWGK